MHVDLKDEERAILVQVLESELTNLRSEIHDTHRLDYKNMLKARELIVRQLLSELRLPEPQREPVAA